MSLPGRHSLLWKLCALLVVLCLSIIWFSRSGGAHLERRSYHLSEEARQVLKGYAVEAHAAWRSGSRISRAFSLTASGIMATMPR